ncbi:MAG TPA: ABC transporter substrate binding protein [Dongiaceae bacterium]|nr:ABC transporter substrate binding protein [Dongiaceae bacterium]
MIKSLVGGLLLSFAAQAWAGGKVLVVHSYHAGYAWVDAVDAGIKKGLAGADAQVETFYMDCKRHPQKADKEKAGAAAKAKLEEFKPDVVITADDDAQMYFAKEYSTKPAPQFVFCGVNAEPDYYGYPTPNTTGVLERPHFVETMKLVKSILPKTGTVALISDDSMMSGWVINQMKAAADSPVKIVYTAQPSTFADWQAEIKKAEAAADVVAFYTYHTVKKEAGGDSMDPKEVIAWTRDNLKKPAVGFLEFTIRDGLLCGIAESPEEHGHEAGLMAKGILAGKTAKDFPLIQAKKGTVILNLVAAQKSGIEIPFDIIQSADLVIDK